MKRWIVGFGAALVALVVVWCFVWHGEIDSQVLPTEQVGKSEVVEILRTKDSASVIRKTSVPTKENVEQSSLRGAVYSADGSAINVTTSTRQEETPAPDNSGKTTHTGMSSGTGSDWPSPSKSRFVGKTIDYRSVELPPSEKGGKPGELREWLIEPDEGYTAHIEEECRPDENGEMQVVGMKEYVANQVLLTLGGEIDYESFKAKMEKSGAVVKPPLMELEKGSKIVAVMLPTVSFDAVETLNEAVMTYNPQLQPEHDGVAYIDRAPDDGRYSSQWGMAKIQAPEAWNIRTDASSVTVAVLDTGVNYTHEDLAANMWVNPSQGSFSGVTGDRYGMKCFGGAFSGDPKDDHGHGSHCAGIIGAVGNNSKGVAGVAWATKIMALKWLNSEGSAGYNSDIINCLSYARAKGANIISCSFHYDPSASLYNAYAALRSSGIIAVCAAGNQARNTDSIPQYPASYDLDNIVSVAATTSSDGLASFSNYGLTSVDIAAPGVDILSTVGVGSYKPYESWPGTSMATPFVAGALALLKAQYPSYTYLQLIQKLYAGGDSVSALSGKCTTGKRLNVYKALSTTQLVPPTPTASRGTYSDRVAVSWSSVSGATHYRVYRSTSSTGSKTALGSWQTGTTYSDYSVTSGTTYYYWVCAATSSSGANQSAYGSYATGYAQPPTGDSWDPGDDTPSGGTAITPSTSRLTHGTHTLSTTDKYDFFKISMTAGVRYTFETTGSTDTYGELFNSTSTNVSNRVAYNDDADGANNRNFMFEYTPSASGTYYLRVRAWRAGASGSYSLAYQRSATGDSWDSGDDSPSGGTLLSPTTTVQTHGPHTLSSDDRYDFFRISMTAGRTYVFESTGSYDMYGELFSSTSTNASYCVAYNDDADGANNRNFKIEYTPTISQTYYLRVRRYTVGAEGSYSLKYSYRTVASDIKFREDTDWSSPALLVASTNTMVATSTFQTNQTVWICFQHVIDTGSIAGPVTNCAKVISQTTGASRFIWHSIVVQGYSTGYYYTDRLPVSGLEPGAYTVRIALNEDNNGNRKAQESTYTNNIRTLSFTVVNPQKTLSSVAISGNAAIQSKGVADYRCIGTYSDGSTADVSPTWSITSGSSYATVNSSGRITAGDTTVDRTITLQAVFGGKSATKTVTIRGSGAGDDPNPINPFPSVVSYPRAPMIVEGVVYINGVLAVAGDQFAAYSSSECRGVARIAANGRVTMGVNIAEAGESISFKVWDASEGDNGTIYNCLQTLAGTSEPQGTASSPIRFDATSADPFGQVTPEPLVPPTIIEASVTIDGEPASDGDVLAVFSGNAIVGKVPVSYVNQDGRASATCRPVMFFSGRKSLSFRLWDADTEEILESSVTLSMNAGDVQGTMASPYVIEFTSEAPPVPCAVSLNSGWNLVSFSVLPESPTPANVFSQVSSSIQYVSDVSGNLWGPAIGNGGLSSIRLGAGYWVRSSANNITWNVEGRGDTETQINLSSGWNLIGYTLPRAGQVADVLRTALASGKVQYITDQAGNVYPGGSLSNLRPGVGYWLRSTGSCSLKFDSSGMATASDSLAIVTESLTQNELHPFGTPAARMGVPTVFANISVSLFGKLAAYGDYLAVFDRSTDEIVSVQPINSETGTLTFTIMGLRTNDKFYFKVWNSASGLSSPEIFTTDAADDLTITNPDDPISGRAIEITGTKPTYTVAYNLGGKAMRTGGGALTQNIPFGGDVVDPVISVNSGWRFVDWDYSKRTDIRGPLTITALYEQTDDPPPPTTYTVTYKPGVNGTGSQQTATKTENVALTLKGAIFMRTGYTQTGWATSDGGAKSYNLGASYTANVAATLYPFWTANTYTVTFNANGGTVSPTFTTVTYDSTYGDLPTPVWSGYAFDGWYTAASGGTKITSATKVAITAAQTLYAKWEEIVLPPDPVKMTYSVIYNPGVNGTGAQQTDTKTEDVTLTLKDATFTRTGYTQTGWATSDGGAKEYDLGASYMENADVTLYPFWTANSYIVTLDRQGGSGGSAIVTATYGSVMPSITVPQLTGYVFEGYYTATSGGGTQYYTASGTSVRNWDKPSATTLYAKWTPINGDNMPYPLFPARGLTIVNGVVTAWNGTGPVDMIIPEGVRAIDEYVFHRAWYELGVHVRSVKLPESLVTISEGAFVGSHLEAVSFGSNVRTIGHSAFANTHLSGEVRLPEGVVSIGKQAFMGTRITDIYLPTSLCRLARAAFESCVSLLGIHFAGNAPLLDLSMNDSFVSRSTSLFEDCNEDAEVYIVNGTDGWMFGSDGGVATWPIGDEFARRVKYDSGEPVDIDATPASAASEYNGYLVDADGAVKGTIQVKVGKPGKKDGKATVSATAVVGAKKFTLKASDKGKAAIRDNGPTMVELAGKGAVCTVVLGAKGLSGYYGDYGEYLIDGTRNLFASKDKGEQNAANAILAKWLGSFMVIWDGGSLSVNIAAKGKAKVSGTLADGTKLTATAQLLIGEERCCVPVAVPKANLVFVLWLSQDGQTIEAEGLGEGVNVGLFGTLANGATFQINADEFMEVFGQEMLHYLPDGVPVVQKGTKWTLPKAGKVVYKNGALDESKLGENPCGLKLTYKAKEGTFTGSFKVYAEVRGKPKATTVNVTGFLLNGVGHGTATVKGKGSVPVTVE